MRDKFSCLLIDDDQEDQEFFMEALKACFPRANCEFATDYPTAFNKLTNRLIDIPNYIFVDWSLPNTDVKESLRQLHAMKELKQSAIFILSGALPPLQPTVLEAMGIEKVLLKQNSISDLQKELLTVLVK